MRCAPALAIAVSILALAANVHASEDAADAEPEGRWELGLDSLASLVHVPIVTVVPVADGTTTRTVEDARVFVRNVTANAAFRIAEHWRVGALLPWTSSTITVGDRRSRGATSFGNAELDGWFDHAPFAHTTLTYGLGVSGATAQGETTDPSDQASSDQEATNRAVTTSGGRVVSARYAARHYAFIVSVAFQYHRLGWQLEPYLRIEDLRDMTAAPLHRDTLHDELGTRLAKRIGRFDAGLRSWVDWVPVGFSDRDRNIALAVEPEARVHIEQVTVILGLIVPLMVPLSGPRIVSGELGLVVEL